MHLLVKQTQMLVDIKGRGNEAMAIVVQLMANKLPGSKN